MTDVLQRSLHASAAAHPLLAGVAVFCANDLLFVLLLALAAVAWQGRARVTWGFAARALLSGVVAALLTLALKGVIVDVRPYVAEGYLPLAHAASDNGFPSDHTLVAALLAGWAWWIHPRALPVFVAGTVAVLLGRLAIGAHHTLDVLGSLLYALLGLAAGTLWRPAGTWTARTVLPAKR
ncbi:phosphatase PAP2 family protein [Deinococcus aquiradiocola]|nr:phosphatase PAP2 family protein [Deinococcus aquiradiocola]